MVRIKEAIVVEGKYDKNTISQIVETNIFETSGFRIFSDIKTLNLLRMVADKQGLIIMTDSDGAGKIIRGHLKGMLEKEKIKQAYIPDIYGIEKRKTKFSSEGKIGVEGMKPEVIIEVLRRAGATFEGEMLKSKKKEITTADLYIAGFSGSMGSSSSRRTLLRQMNFPENMSGNAFLEVMNLIYTREEFYSRYVSKMHNPHN